ncbi:MAG TPA: hypothetical protein VFK05_13745, partial [Polyangiaceae bacterium]|nr:hypothetical protein [Polyangiaceae bacterium]
MSEGSMAVGAAPKPKASPKTQAPAAGPSKGGASPVGRKTAKQSASAGARGLVTPDATAGPDAPRGLSPAEKARLSAVDARAGAQRAAAGAHQSPKDATDDAQAAAKEPQSEADGKARGQQAEHLEDNPPPDPEIVAKVQRIKQSIRDKRPVKEDELPKADPKAMATAAGQELSGDVKNAAGDVKQGYSGVDDKPKGTPSKDAPPMPADAPTPPAPAVNASAAAPDPVNAAQVSVADDKKAVDNQAKDAKLDRPEVKDITDGPVAAARDAQKGLAELAIWGPDAVVKSAAELKAGASADFAKAEAEALKKLLAARHKQLAEVKDQKEATKTGDEAKREALGAKLESIYSIAEDQVRAKLEPLVATALKTWEDGIKPLSDNFDHALGRVDFYIKQHKDSFLNRVGDAIFGLPQWIVDEYEAAEHEFAEGAGALALNVSSWVNGIIRDCQRIISTARKNIEKEIEGLDPALRDYALQKQKDIGAKFDALSQDVETTKKDFTKQLTQKLVTAVKEKDEKIQKLREESKGLVQKFEDAVKDFIDDPLRAIVNGLLKIVGIPPDSFWALVDKLGSVVQDIADRPMVFANNLVAAIKLGFQQFKDNIVTHLIKGLLTWLTSKLKDAGVEAPKDLSLKSMITLFLQILGVTWPKIRAKLVKYIGEKNMRRIELAVEFLTAFINDGWDGVWNLIKQKLDPQQIVDIVLNAVKSFIIESIVKKAAEYIISLFNPAGVIYQALRLLYDAIAWVYENASRIFTFVEAVVNGAANIMAGAIGGAANTIEKALGMIVPIVIDLFAQLVGLGGLPDKVKEVVGGLQEMVSQAIDKVIAWVADKIGLQKEKDQADDEVGISVPVPAPDQTHRLYIKVEGSEAVLMVASAPMTVPERLVDFRKRLPNITDAEKRARAESLLDGAKDKYKNVKETADEIVREMKAGNQKDQ